MIPLVGQISRGHTIDALWVVGPLPLNSSDFSIFWPNVVYSEAIELDYRVE